MPLIGLWISDTGITDSAADSVAHMKDLTILSVSGTKISGKFLQKLKALNKLASLEVRRCPNVTPADVEGFRKQHEHCLLTYKPKVGIFAVFGSGATKGRKLIIP
jgi:hypothetical protein